MSSHIRDTEADLEARRARAAEQRAKALAAIKARQKEFDERYARGELPVPDPHEVLRRAGVTEQELILSMEAVNANAARIQEAAKADAYRNAFLSMAALVDSLGGTVLPEFETLRAGREKRTTPLVNESRRRAAIAATITKPLVARVLDGEKVDAVAADAKAKGIKGASRATLYRRKKNAGVDTPS